MIGESALEEYEPECDDLWHIGAEVNPEQWCPTCGWCDDCGVMCDCREAGR